MLSVFAVSLASSCTIEVPAECSEGTTAPCDCAPGLEGTKSCTAEGKFAGCVCTPVADGTGDVTPDSGVPDTGPDATPDVKTDPVEDVACVPDCGGKECGDDGCGGSCGTCPAAAPSCSAAGICEAVCEPACEGKECGDDGCGGSCGTCPGAAPICAEAGLCVSDCTADCTGKACGNDGCGGSCGTCGASETCADYQCVADCTPDCGGKECGTDGCGGSCGTCDAGQSCSAGVCVTDCTPDCTGKTCGDDGCGGSCGTCPSGDTCSATGQCVCVPSCGTKVCGNDGCGGSCGTCPGAQICTDSGACVTTCTPSCTGKECGGDGCGGSCGSCAADEVCTSSGTCEPSCVPDCVGKQCGSDGCGGSCGGCTGVGQVCDSTTYTCVCQATSDTICEDGDVYSMDSCGQPTTLVESCAYGCTNGACNSCTPQCAGKFCGPDGCGGTCGICQAGYDCVDSKCCQPGYDSTCVGNDVYEVDSCGNTGKFVKTCTYACQLGECTGGGTCGAAELVLTQEVADDFTLIPPWQSFKAPVTGNLVIVETRPNAYNPPSGIAGTLHILAGEGTGGQELGSQSFSIPSTGGSPWQVFSLNDPVSVVEGQTYTWWLEGANNGIQYATGNKYTSGKGGGSNDLDLTMRIWIEPCQ